MRGFIVPMIVLLITAAYTEGGNYIPTTADRISKYGYPVESHTVQTSDGFVLEFFRIPFSPKGSSSKTQYRPVVFLQHGLLCSSDSWILTGPKYALPYMLADAGFDVWIGNSRGNFYGQKNIHITKDSPGYWDFSWHEIAVLDIPALIDYILNHTQQESLHFVGYSQGTTTFFAFASSMPSYNMKIRTSHMMGPTAFVNNSNNIMARFGNLLHQSFYTLERMFGNKQLLPKTDFWEDLMRKFCVNELEFNWICLRFLEPTLGWKAARTNLTMLEDILIVYPSGASTNQFIHYVQLYNSGHFRRYDYGPAINFQKYGQPTPPDYDLQNISAPVWLYYSSNDEFIQHADIERLIRTLPNVCGRHAVPDPEFNHFDFMWGTNVKSDVYDQLVDNIVHFEKYLIHV